jgi:hypothetical protein
LIQSNRKVAAYDTKIIMENLNARTDEEEIFQAAAGR